MTLRNKLTLYLIVAHAAFAAIGALVLLQYPLWLLAVELLLVVSLAVGLYLIRSLLVPLEMVRTGADLIGERDFTSRFVEVGHPEMDALVRVYNRMIDELREERLRLEEHQIFLARIIAGSPSAIVTTDFDSRIDEANASAVALLQRSREALLGATIEELGGTLPATLRNLEPNETTVVNVQGRRFKCWRAQFYDRGFMRDFYLVDELTEEMRASEHAAYDKLIRMMSHEVSNTVGAVRSLMESSLHYAAQLEGEDESDFRSAVTIARERLENLNRFVSGFADVVRIPPPQPAECDLEGLVRDLLVLTGPLLAAAGIDPHFESTGDLPPILADKNQLEQVLMNVLKNAMEAMNGNGGTLTIRLAAVGGNQVLSVRDSGPGIPNELQHNLFTPFYSTKRDGRGLGLILVQEILRQHGFDFSLQNAPEGGAEFRITF